MKIVIRVYANLKGLARTYKDMDILSEPGQLEEFVRGFNMGDAMCDYVDAGTGKECSDEKVKGGDTPFMIKIWSRLTTGQETSSSI